jgi:GR25 family glycosyltransferase involved in LPS biosynthesis
MLQKYFDKVYYINLDKRPDRRKEIESELQKHSIIAERFSAINGNVYNYKINHGSLGMVTHTIAANGIAGCIASHTDIYKKMIAQNIQTALIIEDDCVFIDNLNEYMAAHFQEIPKDWGMIYLGCRHELRGGQFVLTHVSPNIIKSQRMITTTCYGITLETAKKALELINFNDICLPIDGYLAVQVHPIIPSYAFDPPIAWQRASFSDIQMLHTDYEYLMRTNNRIE